MTRGRKQYFIECCETRTCEGVPYSRTTQLGNTSTIKSAKSTISWYRREYRKYNPKDFRVYDYWAEVDPTTGHVPCVYEEE